jgi:ATP-dependent Clp protease ATP-binding subunit ClpC
MRRSVEVDNIVREARDMARGAGQPLTTGHVLLGMLVNPNRARNLLEDLGVDSERIVEAMRAMRQRTGTIHESDGMLDRALYKMIDASKSTGIPLAGSLHLLLGVVREKDTLATTLFRQMGIAPAEVRTMVIQRLEQPPPPSASWGQQNTRAFDDEPASSIATVDPTFTAETPRPSAAPHPQAQAQTMAEAKRASAPRVADPPGGPMDGGPRTEMPQPTDTGYELDPEIYPLLTSLGRNLTAEAASGGVDPVIGRDDLIDAMVDVLNKRKSNNPVLIGEPGVGKTAVVEGLALAMLEQSGRVHALRDRVIISLDVGSLVAGTELRGAFSRRMAKLKDEVRNAAGSVIVFIDEIHTLVGAGSGDGALDASNDLKAALARGEFPCIGATTPHEYHRHIEKDPALERRFQPLEVPEPSEEEALEIIEGIAPHYESHHGVIYLPEALSAAVRMSRRYIVERCLPDKAINLIDTAAARAVRLSKETVEPADIAQVVSEATQIPIERLLMTDSERILGIRGFLEERLVGHVDVLDVLSRVIQRSSAGFASKRPIGSFLFLGPTGVGKTETAKALADFLFCSKDALTRFDMSEFMERHSVSRLLGAAPGYVGYEDAGALTAALSRRPYQIILFDEIEKAHPDVLNILLQILDEGHLTDSKGKTLTFANTVVVMTSNLGAEALTAKARRKIGFGGKGSGIGEAELKALREKAKKALPPELWGRIDEICVFSPLSRDEVAGVASLLIVESSDRLNGERRMTYTVSDEVVDFLIENGGYDPTLGARPMRRAVQTHCEGAISLAILEGTARDRDRLHLAVEDGQIQVENRGPEPRPESTPIPPALDDPDSISGLDGLDQAHENDTLVDAIPVVD